MASEQILDGQYFRRLKDSSQGIWERISFWTKAKDVYFEDGTNLESKTFGNGGGGKPMFAYDCKDYVGSASNVSVVLGSYACIRAVATPLDIGDYFLTDSRWSGVTDKADLAQYFLQRQGIAFNESMREKSDTINCRVTFEFNTTGGGKGTINNNEMITVPLSQLAPQTPALGELAKWAYSYSFAFPVIAECVGFNNTTSIKGLHVVFSDLKGNEPSIGFHNGTGEAITFDYSFPAIRAYTTAIGTVTRLDTPI